MTTSPPNPAPIRRCPICSKPRVEAHAPFCSTRCRDRDLIRWLDDGYALPGRALDAEDEAPD